jgi:hypothetical protein
MRRLFLEFKDDEKSRFLELYLKLKKQYECRRDKDTEIEDTVQDWALGMLTKESEEEDFSKELSKEVIAKYSTAIKNGRKNKYVKSNRERDALENVKLEERAQELENLFRVDIISDMERLDFIIRYHVKLTKQEMMFWVLFKEFTPVNEILTEMEISCHHLVVIRANIVRKVRKAMGMLNFEF